jgi:hypothetical protein
MKNELTTDVLITSILNEIESDPILRNCNSFGELHEYCDANTLGVSLDLIDLYGLDIACDMMNEAHDTISNLLPIN